jgi:hypothetical protein
MVNVGIFYDPLEYFMAIWYNSWPFVCSLWSFVIFFPIWYVWTKRNLATLVRGTVSVSRGKFGLKILRNLK